MSDRPLSEQVRRARKADVDLGLLGDEIAALEAKLERLERAISEQPCDCLRTQSIRGYKCWRCAALKGREP